MKPYGNLERLKRRVRRVRATLPGRCRDESDAPIFCKWLGWGAGCWSSVLGEAAEAGRPVALSARGFGLPGGDVGCPGEDLGEHVQ